MSLDRPLRNDRDDGSDAPADEAPIRFGALRLYRASRRLYDAAGPVRLGSCVRTNMQRRRPVFTRDSRQFTCGDDNLV